MNHRRTDSPQTHRSRLLAPAVITLAIITVLGIFYLATDLPPASDQAPLSASIAAIENVSQDVMAESVKIRRPLLLPRYQHCQLSTWNQTVQKDIQQTEYRVTWQESLSAKETPAAYLPLIYNNKNSFLLLFIGSKTRQYG